MSISISVIIDTLRRVFMMHSLQCCTQKPFNHKKEVEPGFGLVTHLLVECPTLRVTPGLCPGSLSHDPSYRNQQTGILWALFPQSCGSNPYLQNTESNSSLKAQTFFIYTMTFPALAKFQLSAFDLRNEMYCAPTMLLEFCN